MNGYIIMCFSKGIFMCGYLYSLGPQEGKQQHNSTDIKKIAEEIELFSVKGHWTRMNILCVIIKPSNTESH